MRVGILLLTLVLTGAVQAGEKVTVVLDWAINTNHSGIYVAQKNGYFDEAGLEVSIELPPQTGGASMLLAGTAQVAVSYQEEVTFARAANKPLVAIAAILQHNTSGFASRAVLGIESPRDFEGKRYGGWGSPIEEAMLRALIERDGGDASTVEILPIGGMDFFAATEDAIDFVWVFEGWDGVAAQLRNIDLNYIPLATVPSLDYYTPVLASSEQWLDENSDTARAFLKAVSRGYAFAIEKPDKAANILLEFAPELDADLVINSQNFLTDQYQADAARWGEMELTRWESYAQWLATHDLLEGEFNAADAFSTEYLP